MVPTNHCSKCNQTYIGLHHFCSATKPREVIAESHSIPREREIQYGHPKESFGMIAGLWSSLFGIEISDRQVALAMILLKVCRENHKHLQDNLDDINGYVECLNMLRESESDDSSIDIDNRR